MLILSRNYESIRILVYLCSQPGYEAQTRDIALALKISLSVCRKRVWQLCETGVLAGARGFDGGVKLCRPPEEIHIGDVVGAIEAQRSIRPDHHDAEYREVFEEASVRFLDELNRQTVRDVYGCRPSSAPGANEGRRNVAEELCREPPHRMSKEKSVVEHDMRGVRGERQSATPREPNKVSTASQMINNSPSAD
jgi:Rrf2 family nitric oxide-sensitive transcriptional repressor